MKQLINLLTEQVRSQINDGKSNIVRIECFDNPIIYKSICESLCSDSKVDLLLLKLSIEKYREFEGEDRPEWRNALDYLHKGNNIVYLSNPSEGYIEASYVDFDNALTKWRNRLAELEPGKTGLLFLMGSEVAQDTGGLVDTSFAITPKHVINILQEDYSRWFKSLLVKNELDDTESYKALNTLYRAIFSSVNIDLVKLSNFIDSIENDTFVSIQDLITYICETLNVTWGIPSIKDTQAVPKVHNLAKGTLTSAKIVIDGINFIKRADDIPSQSALSKLEKKFKEYAKENGIDYADPFPHTDALFVSYSDFENCVIEFLSGKELEANRERLLRIDFAYISGILGKRIRGPKSSKPEVVSGEPLEAYYKMIFSALPQFKKEHVANPTSIIFRVDRISLSDCTDEQKEDSYMHICNYVGGMLSFLNEASKASNELEMEISYASGIDPFQFVNYNDFSDKIKCSGKWGDPCKISYTVTLKGDEVEDKYEYKWAFSPNSPWLNAFSYLGNVFFREVDSYVLPTLVTCRNVQEFLGCESEDEFYSQMSQIRDEVLFEEHRRELRKYFSDMEVLKYFEALCNKFRDFTELLTQKGLFSALNELREVVRIYTEMMQNAYDSFDTYNAVQKEKLPLLVNCFIISSNDDVIDSCDMREVIVPAYNPVVLEKIDAKLIFVRAGFEELLRKLNFNVNSKYREDIENLIQLSSITQAMDTVNKTGSNYLICRGMWEYFGIYYDVAADSDMISGNSLGSSIVTDDEDASAMLHISPMSNIVVRNVMDYIRTFPARIDGIKIAFVGPEDMQHIVAAIHAIAKNLDKQNTFATINIVIICINSKKNSKSYLRKWLDSYFNDEKCVTVNTYLKNIVITTKDDVEAIKPLLNEYDLCFNYNILDTVGVDFEPVGSESFDKDSIKFPMTFTPDTIPATYGKTKKVCISQFQFLASKAQTQISNVMGNPHIVPGTYKTFRKLELSENETRLIDISHECCKWVVCIDPTIDRHMLESNKSKIIGFTTGEGKYGELNVTVSARKDILTDIREMLRRRITEKFSNWDDKRLADASSYCVEYLSQFMDGSRILKALNPYDYEIHSFLAYLLTLQILEIPEKKDKYLLRTLISLDSYKHWFEEDDEINPDNMRPDFMLLEIPNSVNNLNPQDKLYMNIKIIECKMGYKSQGHLAKAQTQLEKGIKTMSTHWDPDNGDIMHRYWMNQLYRAIIFTKLDMDLTSDEYSIIRSKIYGILQSDFEIRWTGDIFAFWLDSNSEIPDEWGIESALLDQMERIQLDGLMCHNYGQMFIQKMLLPPDNRGEAFEYVEIDADDETSEDEEVNDAPPSDVSYGNTSLENGASISVEQGNTIPKLADVLTPFAMHLNDDQEHSRRSDLHWFEAYFGIKPEDKKVLYESNGHPKWETILDFAITELRKNEILENSQVGAYHMTAFGKMITSAIDSKGEDESFSKFVERMRIADKPAIHENGGSNADMREQGEHPEIDDETETSNSTSHVGLGSVRLLIGEDLRTKERFYWEFGNPNLNNRHLLINGNSGCGKTYCIQALLMEAAMQGVSAVVFDYTGGFANSKLDPQFKDTLGDRIKQRVVKIAKIPVNPFEKNDIQIDEDILVPEEDADVADKISEIFKAVYDLGDQQKSAIYSAVLNGLKTYESAMTFPLMVEELENIGTNYAKTVISKIQAFSDFNPFAVDNTFSWSDIRDSSGMIYIFQLAGYGRDIQVLLTELLLWDIWNFCVKNGDESKPFILVMDEAQNLSHGEKSPSAKILTEGRKFGISGWYATQFMKPQLSDDEIQRLQQAGQKLYFCPPDDGVTTVAKNIDITSQGAKDWADRLKKLKKGECVTCGNMVRNGKWSKYEPRIVKVTSLDERVGE